MLKQVRSDTKKYKPYAYCYGGVAFKFGEYLRLTEQSDKAAEAAAESVIFLEISDLSYPLPLSYLRQASILRLLGQFGHAIEAQPSARGSVASGGFGTILQSCTALRNQAHERRFYLLGWEIPHCGARNKIQTERR